MGIFVRADKLVLGADIIYLIDMIYHKTLLWSGGIVDIGSYMNILRRRPLQHSLPSCYRVQNFLLLGCAKESYESGNQSSNIFLDH